MTLTGKAKQENEHSHKKLKYQAQGYKYAAKLTLSLIPKDNQDGKYVHQLQNLYYSLVGEELTLQKTIS